MTTEQQSISDDQIREVVDWLDQALSRPDGEARHERVGRAVRALTRRWAEVNPDFDRDAWYPISSLLDEHWDQIREHMSAVEAERVGDPGAGGPSGDASAFSDRGGAVHRALDVSLSELGSAFQTDELAFLAVTSKVELPIRDRLAWNVQRVLGEEFTVAREWQHADLAVLDHDGVVAQLEAKALYAFDVLRPSARRAYLGRLVADATKMAALAASDRYLLSMLVDVRGDIRPELHAHVVKYSSGIAAAIKSSGDAVRPAAHHQWLGDLADTFDCATVATRVDAGRVWDLGVSVDLFLTGPLPAE